MTVSDRWVRVQTPATTANLGPGFDSLGIALGLYNTVELRPSERPIVEISGEGAGQLAADETNLAYSSACRLAAQVGHTGHWHLRQENRIPLARGLGSSSAAIVSGIIAAQEVLGYHLDRHESLALAAEIEGHPDNVAPALLGGLTVCFEQLDGSKAAVPLDAPVGLQAVLAIPDVEVSTHDARRALPRDVPLWDAVFNTGQAAAVVAMLTSGKYDRLADAMRDRLHQPYRAHLVPGMEALIQAAIDANARGAALSGSGPTVVALAEPDDCEPVREAMMRAAGDTSAHWQSMVLPLDNDGVRIMP